jgi:signal transduction histidine kinase
MTIHKKNGKFISSKSSRKNNEIGMGLGNVESVTKKYGGVFELELIENEFVIKLVLPDKKVT